MSSQKFGELPAWLNRLLAAFSSHSIFRREVRDGQNESARTDQAANEVVCHPLDLPMVDPQRAAPSVVRPSSFGPHSLHCVVFRFMHRPIAHRTELRRGGSRCCGSGSTAGTSCGSRNCSSGRRSTTIHLGARGERRCSCSVLSDRPVLQPSSARTNRSTIARRCHARRINPRRLGASSSLRASCLHYSINTMPWRPNRPRNHPMPQPGTHTPIAPPWAADTPSPRADARSLARSR